MVKLFKFSEMSMLVLLAWVILALSGCGGSEFIQGTGETDEQRAALHASAGEVREGIKGLQEVGIL